MNNEDLIPYLLEVLDETVESLVKLGVSPKSIQNEVDFKSWQVYNHELSRKPPTTDEEVNRMCEKEAKIAAFKARKEELKRERKEIFLLSYPWYDYGYLLRAVEDWCRYSSEMHQKLGMSVNSPKKAKILKTMAALCKRINEGDYCYYGAIVTRPPADWMYSSYDARAIAYDEKQKQNDLDYLCKLVSKNLFNLWD
jgi:hypothetical protein